MSFQRQAAFWLGALAVFAALLWIFSGILLPFLAGLVLAYFLDPVADALERLGLPRLLATLAILIASLLVVVVAVLLVVPVLGDQIGKFASDLPGLINGLIARFNDLAPQWMKDIVSQSGADVQGHATEFAGKAAGWIVTLLSSLLSGGMALVNLVSLMFVTPIVAFYLLEDWDKIVAKVDGWLPRQHAPVIRGLASQIDESLAGFIRGQGTVCLLLASFYAIGLSVTGLRFGLAIGITAGLLTFIPYAGAIIGGVLAIGVALVQFWPDYTMILMVVGVFAVGQFIEGNILSPKLVGHRVGLHPVWLMFALFAFGYLFGFVGLLMAVPMAAAAGVLVRFAIGQYLRSKLYLGPGEPAPVPTDEAGSGKRRRK